MPNNNKTGAGGGELALIGYGVIQILGAELQLGGAWRKNIALRLLALVRRA